MTRPRWGSGPRRIGLALAAALLAVPVVVARRPDAVLHPQFYAEDASVWYYQAYSVGQLKALLIPYGSYLQTLPRLVAAAALHVPFAYAPALMNAFGIGFQVLPVFYLLSGRLDGVIPSRRLQWVLAAVYLLIPYSYEVDVSITNAQWHLALLCLMIVLGSPPGTRAWWAFDLAAVVLSGLTGLFSVLLGLVLVLKIAFVQRDRWTYALTAVTGVLAALQVLVQRQHQGQRPYPGPGFDPGALAHVLGGPLLVGQTFGTAIYRALWASVHWHHTSSFPFFLAAITIAISAWAAWRGPWQLRLALLYVWLQVLLVFAAPQTSRADGYLYSVPPLAGRYYFAFYAVWFAALVWLLLKERRSLRVIPGVLLTCSVLVAMPLDFSYPPLRNFHFQRAAAAFAAAPPGTVITFEVPPHWLVRLRKR